MQIKWGFSMRAYTQFLLVLIVVALAPPSAGARGALVDGRCFLEGAADHSGTTVVFEASSLTAVTDSTTTDTAGHYSAGLPEGVYIVRFRHDGYLGQELPEAYAFGTGSLTLPDATLGAAGDFSVIGSVGGVWLSGSTYDVVGDIFVEESDTLVIEPGVRVRFLGSYGLEIFGTMSAVGTAQDSIRFTSGSNPPAPGDWRYVKFLQGYPSGVSNAGEVRYCVFEYGGVDVQNGHQGILQMESWTIPFREITVEHSTVRHSSTNGIGMEHSAGVISDNIIEHNGSRGMAVNSSTVSVANNIVRNNITNGITIIGSYSDEAVVSGNTIIDNGFDGIDCGDSTPLITGNTVSGNQIGVKVTAGSPTVEHNVIHDNRLNGISCSYSGAPILWNNVIFGHPQYGIYGSTSTHPDISMNVVMSNRWGIGLTSSSTQVVYNNVWDNTDFDYGGSGLPPQVGIVLTVNANGDPCDGYLNISQDPGFVSADDFHLQASSPCIDAGPDTVLDPDGTRADIGAYYYDQSLVAIDDSGPAPVPTLRPNVPNPFNPMTEIAFDLPAATNVRVQIYDLSGRLVRTLMDSKLSAGHHVIQWDGRHSDRRNTAAGTYLVRLMTDRHVKTRKVSLVR